jgi:hypothetical protein
MVLDAANNRLLVLESGCNVASDGGVGAVTRRGIEAISLTDGSVSTLMDLSSQPFPQALYYVDQHHVVVQLDTAYMWDPASSTLGAAIPNAPSAFTLDGEGNLVGLTQPLSADGGVGPWAVVSVSPGDGGVTTLGQNPFSLTNGFVGGVSLWPSP